MTPEKRRTFCKELAETANVSKSAKKIGVSRTRVYEIRKEDSVFAEQWDEAVDRGVDALEEEARRRAYKGTNKPVFYQGVECGTIREYSDTLMIFLLKAARPEKYRERHEVEHTGKVTFIMEG